MRGLLDLNNIQIIPKVNSWQEAIEIALKPLVDNGFCEQRYVQGIFDNTLKYGPYYVLCENLAFLHARPEQGAIKTQFAITLLKEPIKFKKDGLDVRVLIAMSAIDNEMHLNGMVTMAQIFSSEKSISRLINATSTQEIYNLVVSDLK